MATKLWIATGSGNWNTGTNWSSSGTPTFTDDVIFSSSYNGNCNITVASAPATCKSLVTVGYTGSVTWSVAMTISGSDDGTATGNSLVLGSGATYSGTGTITVNSAYGGTIKCNGNTLPVSLIVTASGATYTLADTLNIASTRVLSHRAGTLSGSSASVGFFDGANTANSKIISLDTLTVTGVGTLSSQNPFHVAATNYTQSVLTNLYVAGVGAGTKYITMDTAQPITNVYFTATGTGTSATDIMGFSAANGACGNLYFTGTNTGSFLTIRTTTITGNLDFGTSTVSWNYSSTANTVTIGGNITFSPSMSVTATGQPLLLNGNGTQNIIMNGKAFTSNITCNSANGSGIINFNDATILSGSLTVTTGSVNFNSTLDTNSAITLTSGSTTFNGNVTSTGNITQNGGTSSFNGANNTTTGNITLNTGSLSTIGNMTMATFVSNNSNTRTINMGPGTWTLTSTGTVWNMTTSTNATLNAQTSRILINNTSTPASSATFAGGGLTYYTVEYARGASTATNTINGNNTYVNFIDNISTASHSFAFSASSTHTFYKFNVRGSAGANITLNRTATPNPTFLKVGQGIVPYCDYLTVTNITGSPSTTWYTGPNGGAGSLGWVTGAPSSSQSPLGSGGVG